MGASNSMRGPGPAQKTTVNFLQRIGELLALEPVPNYRERADFLLEVSTGYADMMELESRDHNLIAHAGFLRRRLSGHTRFAQFPRPRII
jgi:hypothetical protein